eukprot:6183664-Pleurochrysis_carterae.AAC.1
MLAGPSLACLFATGCKVAKYHFVLAVSVGALAAGAISYASKVSMVRIKRAERVVQQAAQIV